MAHRTCPTAGHITRAGVAVLDDFERGNQLFLEKRAAPSVICKSGKRLHDVVRTSEFAISAFQPPDCNHNFLFDPVPLFNRLQRAAMFAQRGLAVLDTLVGCSTRQILPNCFGKFRLVPVTLDHVLIESHVSERSTKSTLVDTLCSRTAFEALNPTVKTGICRSLLRNRLFLTCNRR